MNPDTLDKHNMRKLVLRVWGVFIVVGLSMRVPRCNKLLKELHATECQRTAIRLCKCRLAAHLLFYAQVHYRMLYHEANDRPLDSTRVHVRVKASSRSNQSNSSHKQRR